MQGDSSKRRRPRQVSDLLKPGNSALGKLLSRAREIERLDRVVASLLPPDFAPRVRVAALRDETLVLVTPSAAFATRLRMDAPHLLKALGDRGERRIRELTIRVAPLPNRPEAPPQQQSLSAAAQRALERFATDCDDDELRAIIEGGKRSSHPK